MTYATKKCKTKQSYLGKLQHQDDDELLLRNGLPTKNVKLYFQPGPLSKILTIGNLQHPAELAQNLSSNFVE